MIQRRDAVKATLFGALFFLLAAFIYASGSAESANVRLNDRHVIELGSGETILNFTVLSNSTYTFESFGGVGVRAELRSGMSDTLISEASGFSFTERLVADRQYSLVVSGTSGTAVVEIMRDALGRCFDRPLEIKNLSEGYNKMVARAQDVHWYRFVPDTTGLYMIATRSSTPTSGYVLDSAGIEIPSVSQNVLPYDHNFAVQAKLVKGATYYLRIAAVGDELGRYTLRFIRAGSSQPMPESIALSAIELELKVGDKAKLESSIAPVGALDGLMLVSTNQSVARVNETGMVTAIAPGSCEIIALGFGGASAACAVTVSDVTLEQLAFEQDALSLPVGERTPLPYNVLPSGIAGIKLNFTSSAPDVAEVDNGGNVLGVSIGEAVITVSSADGKSDAIDILITETPPKYRALLIGEHRYLDGRIRIGSVNTTQGIADLLRSQNFSGTGYEVTMKMDSTREQAVMHIRDAFKDATARDVSLFSINCHGKYENGVPYLVFHDGSRLSAGALEQELRKVPGTVVVLIDCCNSGAFLSKAGASKFTRGMLSVFGADRSGSFAISKYRVLCSSSATQYSYRISTNGIENESSMATAFGRSLCEAGGWDIIKDRPMTMKADLDKNKLVTLEQAYQFTYKRVRKYLQDGADEQDVQVYPRGSQFVLFSK